MYIRNRFIALFLLAGLPLLTGCRNTSSSAEPETVNTTECNAACSHVQQILTSEAEAWASRLSPTERTKARANLARVDLGKTKCIAECKVDPSKIGCVLKSASISELNACDR
ncbi:MAG: hypothetical protein CMH54_00275 [Myxococcales bacterium]|nr:hypothetical protein [Myxococcales bacterium]